jgi:hypothetical protein
VIRDLGPVIAANDVQAQIQGGRTACGRQDVAVVHIQHVRFELHPRESLPERVRQLPVHGCPATVEHACLGERKGSGAQPDQPRSALVSAGDGSKHSRSGSCLDVRVIRHDHRCCVLEVGERPGGTDAEEIVPYANSLGR